MQSIDAWVIDESRLNEGFHVNVIDRETDEQVMMLLAYGLETEEQAQKHVDYLVKAYNANQLSTEVV